MKLIFFTVIYFVSHLVGAYRLCQITFVTLGTGIIVINNHTNGKIKSPWKMLTREEYCA